MHLLQRNAEPSTDKLLPLKRHITDKMRAGHSLRRIAQSHVLNHLRTHANSVRSMAEIIEAVYPDDNEPEYADDCIRCSIFRLRRQGFNIETRWGRGYTLVVPVKEENYDI